MAPLPPHFVPDDQGYDSPASTPITLTNKSNNNNSMEVLQPLTRALVRHSSSIIRNLSKNTLTELVDNTTRRDDSSITEVPVTSANKIRVSYNTSFRLVAFMTCPSKMRSTLRMNIQ